MPASPSSLSVVTDAVQSLDEPAAELSAAESVRLLAALGLVPDPRRRRGVRHSVQSILLLVVAAVMAGKTSWVGIAGWAARAEHRLRICGPPPSAATFARVRAGIDPARLHAGLGLRLSASAGLAAPAPDHAADRRRGIETGEKLGRHRWVIERLLAWLTGYPRLTLRYERCAQLFTAFLTPAATLTCYKKRTT